MKLIFMGTPDFAVPSLHALAGAGHQILSVFSQPDKPKGRGHVMAPTPVKEAALELGLPVYQPVTLKDGEAVKRIQEQKPDIVIVAAYGKILPKELLEIPRYGCVNVHASLLPSYRGAAPIQWAVLNGEEKTGVTIMQMGEGLDTGDMLLVEDTPIGPEETSAQLFDRLAALGASALLKALEGLENGSIVPVPQDHSRFTYAPMITKALCPMDFTHSAQELHNQVRGLQTWPVAATTLFGRPLKVHKSKITKGSGIPGQVLEAGERLVVACGGNTALELCEIQLEGKKKLHAQEFLRGHPVPVGTALGLEG